VAFANVPGTDADKDVITDLFDVIMLNRYYGWYVAAGDLAAAERALEANLKAWEDKYNKPIIMTEYGADTLSGMHGIFPGPWSEEYQVALLEMSHRVFDRINAIVGEQIWNFADFAVASGILRAGGINRKGIFTRAREPKAAADTLRRRWQA
jgi:beta-glucuronidase